MRCSYIKTIQGGTHMTMDTPNIPYHYPIFFYSILFRVFLTCINHYQAYLLTGFFISGMIQSKMFMIIQQQSPATDRFPATGTASRCDLHLQGSPARCLATLICFSCHFYMILCLVGPMETTREFLARL